MKIRAFFALLWTFGLLAAEPAPQTCWEYVMVKGKEKWFTLATLKAKSDDLLREKKKAELAKFEVTATFDNPERKGLVTFRYFENFGLPAYSIVIDEMGKPTEINETIAKESVTVTTDKK